MNTPLRESNNKDDDYGGEDMFDDSCFVANFEMSSFTESTAHSSVKNHPHDSFDNSNLNVSALCCDEEINGYDKLTGKTWIYPTNYPVRDYQFNIIKSALVKNTLVSLPTGLGKTFIAAVIIYNFFRWYPLGKIVFTAPTRPLVAQQIEACYNIIAIPPNDSIEMTGHMQVNIRKTHWKNKRVFFATPQVIYNDIKSGICPGDMIRCLVIDEAHRARGNYAYCQIVSTLTDMGHKTYRILALSATPGSKVEDVTNVIKNLHIAHLELRTESCIDVAPYSHARKINTVIVRLGPELTQLRQQYVEILDSYARRLKQLNILPHNLGNLSKGRVVMLYKEYQNKDRGARHPQHNYIMKDFTLLIALYHGLELLIKHGSRVFLNFFDEHPEKSWIQTDDRLTSLLERLRDDLGINPLSLNCSVLPDGTIPEIPKKLSFGHPKFYKLKEIILEHFNRAKQTNKDTRAIVFCEYRESVNLVHCLLLQCRPLIVPQMFVGQGASGKDGKAMVSQKQQIRAMRAFREGACNVLVATCVAEEGLDVGSVDLIICFDISTRSPVRLVQRCGRTGRERSGQVFILVTEGREHLTLMDCMRQRDGLNNKIMQSKEVENNLYRQNPRMIPHDFTPECQKMFITVAKKDPAKNKSKDNTEKTNKKGQKDLRSMLHNQTSSSSSNSFICEGANSANLITQEEFQIIFPVGYYDTKQIEDHKEFIAMDKSSFKSECQNAPKFSTWLEWQRTLQSTVNIGHSKDTETLVSLLQYCDAKRFNLPPSIQNPTFNTQDFATQNVKLSTAVKHKQTKRKQKKLVTKSPNKKDGDIRALFSVATKSTKSYTNLINDLGIQDDGSIPTSLINLFVDLTLDNTNSVKQCYICQYVCDCKLIKNIRKQHKASTLLTFLCDPKLPDLDLLDDINADSIKKCVQKEVSHLYNQDFSASNNKNETNIENRYNCTNFDLELDFETLDKIKSPDDKAQRDNHNDNTEKNFDLGDIEDIFADSSPEVAVEKEVAKGKKHSADHKVTLNFFGLDSIDDIFADFDESVDKKSSEINKEASNSLKISEKDHTQTEVDENYSLEENPLSPSILSGKIKTNISTSPILSSQNRKFQFSLKKHIPQSSAGVSDVNKRLQDSFNTNNNINEDKSDKSSLENNRDSLADTSNKSMFTITQLVEMINKSKIEKSARINSISPTLNNINYKVHEQNTFPLLLNQTEKHIISTNNCVKVNTSLNEERSTSPILLTQADKKKSFFKTEIFTTLQKEGESLIILDSDSESDDNTRDYVEDENDQLTLTGSTKNPVGFKRKLETQDDVNDDSVTASPYFNKRLKLDDEHKKPLTLQEKVLAVLTSSKDNKKYVHDHTDVNYFSTISLSQKENTKPQFVKELANSDDERECVGEKDLEILRMFRRDSKVNSPKKKLNTVLESRSNGFQKRAITSDDSDDDFVEHKNSSRSRMPVKKDKQEKINHKMKKKKKTIEFLDLEAELSIDSDASGDELSDDSVGSIVDFICDETVTNHEDMQAHYIRSVKSPVKGVFKIPKLPQKYNKVDVLSQAVEEDTYEMDSFCVDSHIGLTQVNDMSELDLAELVLEEERKSKKKKIPEGTLQNDDSPVAKHKNKYLKRQILSDSDDSS